MPMSKEEIIHSLKSLKGKIEHPELFGYPMAAKDCSGCRLARMDIIEWIGQLERGN